MENNHTSIRKKLIEASYDAITHLQGILSEPILQAESGDELGPEKFLNALKAKKQAQTDAFEMLARIEFEQSAIDSLNATVTPAQQKVNDSRGGFAEKKADKA